jgi:hypothetical protein
MDRMYPFFGDKLLANIQSAAMNEFVSHIADLSPATIRDYVNIAKSVVASARDAEGKVLFPREWDDDFLDAPDIDEQKQPTVDREEMEAILRESQEPYLTLSRAICLLLFVFSVQLDEQRHKIMAQHKPRCSIFPSVRNTGL